MTPVNRVNPAVSFWQIIVMSMMAGVTIANIYYAQPILLQISHSLNIHSQDVAQLPVWTQLGFGVGLFFITPLGDVFNRKRMIVSLQLLIILTLLIITQSHTPVTLSIAFFFAGLFAVSVQIVVPMAASLALPQEKGKVIGMVFTGTLTGIVSARVLSGLITQWLGWRWVFGLSMLMIMLCTLLFIFCLPDTKAGYRSHYFTLIKSTLAQAGRFPVLRRVSLLGALVFGVFCAFWTTLTLKLSAAPFHYGSGQIGLFGLLAVVGTLLAPWFGQLSDRTDPRRMQIFSVLLMLAGVVLLQLWPYSLAMLLIATLLIDSGMQITQVNNLSQIYRLDELAHSRINTFFMTTFFLGGATGTAAGIAAWHAGGNVLLGWQLFLWVLMAFCVALYSVRKPTGLTAI